MNLTSVRILLLLWLVPGVSALAQSVSSFSDIPNATFRDLHPFADCPSPVPFTGLTVNTGGRDVTITASHTLAPAGPDYLMGCFNYSGTLLSRHDPVDPAVAPGTFEGQFLNGAAPNTGNDLILDFSEPLTGFGISSLQDGVFLNNLSDGFVAYDGPGGTGNVLGSAATGNAPAGRLRIMFAGVVFPTAQIRSVRLVLNEMLYLDGYAIAVAPLPPACPADLDDGSGTGTPNGGVDINDLLFFLSAFEAGSSSADLDDGSGTGTPNGGVDINDLLFFLAHFEAGC